MTERTPLRSATAQQYDPQYVFNTGRVYRNKVRQCQCCVCATVLACFVIAIVATVGYSVNTDTADTGSNATNNTVLASLLLVQFPLPESSNASWDASAALIEEAMNIGEAGLRDRDKQEQSGPRLDKNSPSYRHQMAVRTTPEATRLARAGYVMNVATRHLAASGVRAVGQGPTVQADWIPPEACADEATPCPVLPYRSADGSCNNPHHPHKWGVAMRPFRRTLPPDYADGVSAPRVASDGSALPSARQVSITVHRPMYRDDPDFTVMLAVWGQFIDHDVTATALNTGGDGSAIACCGAEAVHPECFPVGLSVGDPYFHQYNLSCMEFVRSAPAPSCALGPREQLNQASAYLDGSVVYGTTQDVTSQLRSMTGGQLRMSVTSDGRSLLPYSADPSDGCNQEQQNARGRYCFASGDARANENLHLTTMHLLWARQHNLVAQSLAQVNPRWDDERLFQEARRIVVAQLQHITYQEFLPVLLGSDLMSSLGLHPRPAGYYHGYNSSVDATVANSFAAAAFRFAHTLLPGLMKMLSNGSQEYVELHRMLFNPYSLYNPGHLDATLRGALDTQVERVDPYFTTEVTEHLFQRGDSGPCGLDLVSLNIQRGRDHGLPAYPTWRERCGLSRPRQFQDLAGMVDNESLRRMQQLYASVDDVDLYTGALAEHPVQGGIVGPTITCLLTDQFVRLKRGDRFWYETADTPQAFTPGQLSALRTSSLARIICDNADAVHQAQPQVMRTVGPDNWRQPCSAIPGPDFHLWREEGRLNITLLGTKVRSVSTRLGARVTSGSITAADGMALWGSILPTPIPANTSLRPTWTGALSADVLHGHFSLQRGRDKWLNGRFSLQLSFNWPPLWKQGTFTSPVYFREVQGQEEVVSAPPQTNLAPPLSDTPNITATWLPTAPVVLLGHYSQDRSVFWWTGDIVLTLPGQHL